MARALDAGELASLRSNNQTTELYLAVLTPDTVYTALLNGVPSSDDEVAVIPFDSGSGTPGDTRAAMSVYVGSSAGAYDKGSIRLREAISAASGNMKVGELSDVNWADGDFLTIVREYLLRPRHLRIDSAGTVYQDYDIEFDDPTYNPHLFPAPIPVWGSHACVWLNEQLGTADVLFDASESYTVGGAGAMSYAWTVEPSGTASFDNAAIAAPTLTVTAADSYTIELVLTWTYTDDSQAVSTTSYRHVFAFDKDNLPMKVFQLGNCSGAFSTGGWSFSVTAYDEAQRSEIRDRTLCVLFAKDRYGPLDSDETSIGPLLAGATPIRENVIAWGWIDGESIDWNPEQGRVGFTVQGPHYWLNQMSGFPSGIDDTTNTPDAWTNAKNLTPRSGTALFWLWRCTGAQVMDAFIFPDSVIAAGASPTALSEGSEREFSIYDAPPMSLWRQISMAVLNSVRAHVVCDRYGRMFVQRNLNEILDADRVAGNAPTVMTLAKNDWHGVVSFQRQTVTPVSQLDMSGVAYKAGAGAAKFSLSPGHIFKQYGSPQRIERLALWTGVTAQALADAFCGVVFGNMNNEYPSIQTALAANNRGFDIAPWQYASMVVAPGDTERGISGTFTLLPRRVSLRHDPGTGALLTNIEWEAEAVPVDGIPGDPPPEPPPVSTVMPTLPPLPPEPVVPTDTAVLMLSQTQLVVTFDVNADPPIWYDADPNGDISGTPRNCIANKNGQAYVVTIGAVDGAWYCADITAAVDGSISWTKEIELASGNFGAVGIMGADAYFSSGSALLLIHSDPARGYAGPWGALYEMTSCSSAQLRTGERCDDDPPPPSTAPVRSIFSGLHSIMHSTGAIAGSSYRVPDHRAWAFGLISMKGNCVDTCSDSGSVVDAGFRAISDTGDYVINDAHEIKDSRTGTGVWSGGLGETWPATVLETGVTSDCGVLEDDVGRWHYIKSGSLYRNAVEIASKSEFLNGGAARDGWFFQILDNGDILWQIDNLNQSWIGQHFLLLLFDKSANAWIDKTGNLETVLGTTTWDKSTAFYAFEVPQ